LVNSCFDISEQWNIEVGKYGDTYYWKRDENNGRIIHIRSAE